MVSDNIYLTAFVLRAKNRKPILEQLAKSNKTQAELHQLTGMYRTHVRRTLNELIEKKLVKCLNPKDRIYKIYAITALGKNVLKSTVKIKQ